MNRKDVKRFRELDERIARILDDKGLKCTRDILWKIEPWERMVEAMAYGFPTNFSSILFGRDYDLIRTRFELSGEGLPFEVVWNFPDVPVAMLAKENPLMLNVMIDPHVRFHIDFDLRNTFMTEGREIADIAEEARLAAPRFDEYRARYGDALVDKVIAAGDSLAKYQDPSRIEEEEQEEVTRGKLISIERDKLEKANTDFSRSQEERWSAAQEIEKKIKELSKKTPPRPIFNILQYMTAKSPERQEPFAYDIWNIQLHQARHQQHVMVCHMLNEGWASRGHEYVMHELYREKRISSEEYGVFADFHGRVCRPSRFGFNVYHIGPALYADIEDRWNKGQFGREYLNSVKPDKRKSYFRKGFEGAGEKKIFEIASTCNDRMVYSNPEYFSDEFINDQQLYIWAELPKNDGSADYIIAEKDPNIIRYILALRSTLYGIPLVSVEDGNFNRNKELYLKHHFFGYELNPQMERGAMEHAYFVWGKPVHLETVEVTKRNDNGRPLKTKTILHSYDGKNHAIK